MAKSGQKLTVKQERFCLEYVANGGNASEAYRTAYDTSASASTIGPKSCNMLKQDKIRARVDQLLGEEEARIKRKYQLDQDRVIKEYVRLAFADTRKIFNEDGSIKNITDIDDDTAAAIGGVEIFEGPIDGQRRTKLKMLDKRQPLQDIAKMLGMFREDNAQKRTVFDMTNEELAAIAKG